MICHSSFGRTVTVSHCNWTNLGDTAQLRITMVARRCKTTLQNVKHFYTADSKRGADNTPAHEQTHARSGQFSVFQKLCCENQLPMCKLMSITTNSAPAMMGCLNGFIMKFREDDVFPNLKKDGCTVHMWRRLTAATLTSCYTLTRDDLVGG